MMFCALIIGSLVFIGIRQIEATLVSALGAMIFALPAVRCRAHHLSASEPTY